MNTKPKILALFLLLYSASLSAFQSKNDSLKFSGKLTNADYKENSSTLYIGYNTTDNFDAPGATITFHPEVDSAGNFAFNLPNLSKPYQFTVGVFEPQNGGLGKRKLFSNSFFTEPGDSIKMNIVLEKNYDLGDVMTTMIFSGSGAEKYNLAWQMQNSFFNEYFKDLKQLDLQKPLDSLGLKNKMQELSALLKYYKGKKSYLINSSNINPVVRRIINYEYGAFGKGLDSEWRFRTQLLYDKYPLYRKQIGEEYLRLSRAFQKRPDSVARYCFSYVEELLLKEIFEKKISTKSTDINIKSIYNDVKNKYTGVAKERILGLLLTNKRIQGYFLPMDKNLKDSLLKDGSLEISIPYIKITIEQKILESQNLNSKVFNGEFKDPNGNKFELSSLAGKVILIDIWFNGCWGCAAFHKAFEKVYPRFKGNDKFVVLSVNVDKDKERWMKGIASKLYTSEDYIQVTTGNWFDHPFMRYYNINGASYIMVVDTNGTILPKTNTIDELSSQLIKALAIKSRRP